MASVIALDQLAGEPMDVLADLDGELAGGRDDEDADGPERRLLGVETLLHLVEPLLQLRESRAEVLVLLAQPLDGLDGFQHLALEPGDVVIHGPGHILVGPVRPVGLGALLHPQLLG